jgi:hypothetical protein
MTERTRVARFFYNNIPKWGENRPNASKKVQMVVKRPNGSKKTKWSINKPASSIARPYKIYPIWYF